MKITTHKKLIAGKQYKVQNVKQQQQGNLLVVISDTYQNFHIFSLNEKYKKWSFEEGFKPF